MSRTNRALWLNAAKEPVMTAGPAPYPDYSADELVVRIEAVAMNPADYKLQDLGILIAKYPAILGCDAAGVVEEVGPTLSERFKQGDRVVGATSCLNGYKYSGFQKYVVFKQPWIAKVPASVVLTDAVVLPLGVRTSSACLFDKLTLGLTLPPGDGGRGKTLLVWGASSSIGACGVQLAVAAGYEVFAVASRHNHEMVKSLGAQACFDYNDDDVVADIAAALKGKEVVGAFDAISKPKTIQALCHVLDDVSGARKVIAAVSPFLSGLGEKGVEIRLNFSSTIDTDGVGKHIFTNFLEPALEQGSFMFKPNADVVGQGLESVQSAVDQLREGVSARKLVVTL